MGWFTKKPPAEERWPLERWENIFTNRFVHALMLCKRHEIDLTHLTITRFYAGYLVGFPNYVALHNEKLATGIRKGLMDAVYDGAMDEMVGRIKIHLQRGDPQFNEGLQAGSEDGQRFFRSVEGGLNPYDEHTSTSLALALSDGLIDFADQL